jgi:polyhydroxyalkanoate synthesis regulator phasin
MNSALSALGVRKAISFAIKKANNIVENAGYQRGGVIKAQRGMALVPGAGSGDKVPALLEPGEVVVNREAVKAMGGPQRVNRVNQMIPRFASGGLVQALGPYDVPPIQYDADHAGGNSHWHIHMSTTPAVVAIGKQLQKMGFMVGEHPAFGGIQGSHSPTGGHPVGLAIDVNSAADETLAETRMVARLLSGKGGAALGAVAQKLQRVMMLGPDGPLKALGQAALDRVTNAANNKLAKMAPSEGLEPGAGGGSFAAGPGFLSRNEVRKLLNITGMPDIMGHVAYAESEFNPKATSYADARGLWQIHWPAHAGWASKIGDPYNPLANAKMAARLYGNEGLGPWSYSKYEGAGGGWGQHMGEPFRLGGIVQKLATGGVAADGSGGKGGLGPLIDGPLGGLTLPGQRKDALDKLLQKIKGHWRAALPSLVSLSSNAALWEDLGGRASSLSEDGLGKVPFNGEEHDEAGWLTKALGALFDLRNSLILAEKAVQDHQTRLGDFMEKKVRKAYDDLVKLVRETEKALDKNEKEQDPNKPGTIANKLEKELAKPNNQQSQERIKSLRGKLAKLKEENPVIRETLARATWARDKVKSPLMSVGGEQQTKLVEMRGALLGTGGSVGDKSYDGLESVQGLGAPSALEQAIAPLKDYKYGTFGGRIFDLQQRLQEIATTAADAGGGGAGEDNSALISALQEKLRQATERYQISQLQYQALQSTPYLGAFAKGGVALVGERGPELAHLPSGTRIHDAADTESMIRPQVIINGDIINTPRGMDPVEVLINDRRFAAAVEQVGRRQGRGAGRGLPSSGGGR